MKTFITQPTYLPWIGIFKAIEYCDNFVFYDDVQFERKSWQNRNRILNKSKGDFLYLTVPVSKQPQKTKIKDIKIANHIFYKDHLKKIKNNYSDTEFLRNVIFLLESIYSKNYIFLADLTTDLIKEISGYIGIKSNFYHSHNFGITGDIQTRPLKFAQELKTTEYLTQTGTKEYTNIENYNKCKIEVTFLDFGHPVYRQQRQLFTPFLSIIDLLINVGPNETREIIRNIKLKK